MCHLRSPHYNLAFDRFPSNQLQTYPLYKVVIKLTLNHNYVPPLPHSEFDASQALLSPLRHDKMGRVTSKHQLEPKRALSSNRSGENEPSLPHPLKCHPLNCFPRIDSLGGCYDASLG